MGRTVRRTTGQTRFTSGAATRNRNRAEETYRDLFGNASETASTERIIARAMVSRDSLR